MTKSQKTAKSKKWIRAKKAKASKAKNLGLGQSETFLIPKARKAVTKLGQTFVEVLILSYFNPKRHIQIATDVSSYTIGEIVSQLTSDDLG